MTNENAAATSAVPAADHESVVDEFKDALASNLSAKHQDGKDQFLDGAFIEILLELLLGLFEGCLNQDVSEEKIAKRLAHPKTLDRIRLRSRVRRRVFGSSRKYREGRGRVVADTLLETSAQGGYDKALALVREVKEDPFPDDGIDYSDLI